MHRADANVLHSHTGRRAGHNGLTGWASQAASRVRGKGCNGTDVLPTGDSMLKSAFFKTGKQAGHKGSTGITPTKKLVGCSHKV
eukprot:scaffold188644_cov14-Tisochrysis_lutea.AAC.1